MKVHEDVYDLPEIKNPVVTSGTFDGVHLGHQKILKTISDLARSEDGESVLLTFWPHPRQVLQPDADIQLLTSLEEKKRIIASFGIDHFLIIPFTLEFSSKTSEEFIQDILIRSINTKILVIGYDHRFGKNREGSFEYLKANEDTLGFKVKEIPRQDIRDIGISSTRVREHLKAGKVSSAAEYLGRHYHLRGTVIEGDRLGRTIGYPTANIRSDNPKKLIPEKGVYAILAELSNGEKYKGMMNIGFRPTVKGTEFRIEAHLFDFDREIYGSAIDIHFIERIRDEARFSGIDKLKEQLNKDRETALSLLEGYF